MVAAMKRVAGYALGLFMLLGGLQTTAKAQIAYVPIPGFVPTGATMTVTPVVSADRRYVRLSVDAFFNDLNGFSTFSFPGAAVGGGNFGGAGAGFNAGMNGVIGEAGYESGVQVGNGMNATAVGGQSGTMRAGPLPGDVGGLGMGNPVGFDAGMNHGGGFGLIPGLEGDEAALFFAMENGPGRGVRAGDGDPARGERRSVRKSTKPTRRQSSAARRKSR